MANRRARASARPTALEQDIVDGVMGSLGRAEGTFNLGSGRSLSLNALAGLLIERLRPGVIPEHEPARDGELRFSIADIAAATSAFGYRPTRSLTARLDEVIADVSSRPR